MLSFRTKMTVLALVAVVIASAPLSVQAEKTNAVPAEKHDASKPGRILPFHGKLKSVDNTAQTIAVGSMTIQVTSETKISKDDQPATLSSGVVGEDVSGTYHKADDGKLSAMMIRFGKKADKAEKPKMEDKVAVDNPSAN